MEEIYNKLELISAFQSAGLGLAVGALFAIVGLNPPSPNNLAGITGIIGIFLGWLIVGHLFK